MKKLSGKDLIDFRGRSDRGKKTFVDKIKSPKILPPSKDGGNYWTSSISAICSAYREDSFTLINKKIDELRGKLSKTSRTITKNMYQQNIKILERYRTIDLSRIRPSDKFSIIKKSSGNPLLNIKGLQVQTRPSHTFLIGNKDPMQVGAIWFTAKKDGYRIEEVGMFCELLFRFLKHNYSKKYEVVPKYCVAVDMFSGRVVDYSEIESGAISQILNPTLDEINKLM